MTNYDERSYVSDTGTVSCGRALRNRTIKKWCVKILRLGAKKRCLGPGPHQGTPKKRPLHTHLRTHISLRNGRCGGLEQQPRALVVAAVVLEAEYCRHLVVIHFVVGKSAPRGEAARAHGAARPRRLDQRERRPCARLFGWWYRYRFRCRF